MKRKLGIKIAGSFVLFFLAGCNPMKTGSEEYDTGATTADGDPVYRKNPHPTQAYRITMTIEDAPGPFEWISGTAFYEMTNHKQCTPIEPVAGVWNKSKEEGIPIQFKKLSQTTYAATIYADGMVDSDYYGKGVCRWELTSADISLRATGKHEETRFQPGIYKDKLLSGEPVVTYFWSGGYPKDEMDDYPDSGHSDPNQFKESLRSQLFKVTLVSTKERP
ncbi:hypothetical protein JWH11_00820 [Xanthomonas melonis]|uniref:DUF4377 domain-containing protein n=1 Tax=Xanthomonas melonis TaxID=56456 RepID=A0ABS8NPN5_9XANT|nr:hypothetical protein [Xanthomonas melonis]MCD0256731.1 hypothetical protein [Xanthomonas melonis]MCD0265004.1 hypothetical protein [Xanthomonas melonis]